MGSAKDRKKTRGAKKSVKQQRNSGAIKSVRLEDVKQNRPELLLVLRDWLSLGFRQPDWSAKVSLDFTRCDQYAGEFIHDGDKP